MKTQQRWITFLLICCFVLVVSVAISMAGQKSADIRQLYQGDNAFAHIEVLTSFGPRPAGSAAERAAAEYIASTMESYGLDVTIQEFLVDYFETPQLEQSAPAPKIYIPGVDFAAMSGSGSGDVTASVTAVDVTIPPTGGSTSGCEAADFAGFAAGNIALIQRGTCTFAQKAQNAEAAGAVGVMIFNEGDTPARTGLITGSVEGSGVTIPVVGTTFALGQELYLTLTSGSVIMRLMVDAIAEVRTSQNVIGTLVGTNPKEGIVYMGASYDSISVSPGANSNASGVGAMLEAARVLTAKGHRTKATLKFIAFGAKETGLDGSRNYVEGNLNVVSTKGLGMINLNAIAVGDTLRIGNVGYPFGEGPELMNYAQQKATAMGMAWDSFMTGGDHAPFELLGGVPAVIVTQGDDPYYHTAGDTLDKVQVDTLEANGELATATMYDWAKNPALRAK